MRALSQVRWIRLAKMIGVLTHRGSEGLYTLKEHMYNNRQEEERWEAWRLRVRVGNAFFFFFFELEFIVPATSNKT
jgi:hypothetical protein